MFMYSFFHSVYELFGHCLYLFRLAIFFFTFFSVIMHSFKELGILSGICLPFDFSCTCFGEFEALPWDQESELPEQVCSDSCHFPFSPAPPGWLPKGTGRDTFACIFGCWSEIPKTYGEKLRLRKRGKQRRKSSIKRVKKDRCG